MLRSPQKPVPQAYTLLELLLALALTTVVLLIVTTGISVQLRAFDMSRQQVEQVQLARVLLRQIGNDLRGATTTSESSDNSSAKMFNSEELSLDLDIEDEIAALDELDGTNTPEVNTVLGVYGELDWLRVDVLKAVRYGTTTNEAAISSSNDSTAASMQQIETIVYYVVSSSESTTTETVLDDSDSDTGGLVRRELIGPMAALAAESGTLEYQDLAVAPLAKKVSSIEFRYHDGTEWLEEWDTETSGSLPKAIEIRLFLPATSSSSTTSNTAATSSLDGSTDVCYRLVVSLPMAIASTSTDEESTEDEPLDESSEESSSSDQESSGTEGTAGGTES